MLMPKVGVVSCSGEGRVEGTISRIATRLVLEKLKQIRTVTICLPLFLAGGGSERMFTELVPTIAVDGCEKKCAKIALERYSGKTADSVIVSDLIEKWGVDKLDSSRRNLDEKGMEVASRVAQEIAIKIDEILASWR